MSFSNLNTKSYNEERERVSLVLSGNLASLHLNRRVSNDSIVVVNTHVMTILGLQSLSLLLLSTTTTLYSACNLASLFSLYIYNQSVNCIICKDESVLNARCSMVAIHASVHCTRGVYCNTNKKNRRKKEREIK